MSYKYYYASLQERKKGRQEGSKEGRREVKKEEISDKDISNIYVDNH